MSQHFNINPKDLYPNANYPDYISEKPNFNHFKVGDVLYDKENEEIGIVLGCIDYKGGELRLDSDGMQPIDNLRYATLEDLEKRIDNNSETFKVIKDFCIAQANGVVPKRFIVRASVVQHVTVYVDKNKQYSEKELEELAMSEFSLTDHPKHKECSYFISKR